MPTDEELQQQLLQESKRENERLKRRMDELRRETEDLERGRNEYERKNEELRRWIDESKALIRKTTLGEYLLACHEHVLSGIKYSVNGYLSSETPATNPVNKHCPRLLTPWLDFEQTQAETLTALNQAFPGDHRLFESISGLQCFGARMHSNNVFGETSLSFVHYNSIEEPVRIVLSHLKDVEPGRLGLPAVDRIIFEAVEADLRDEEDGTGTADAVDGVEEVERPMRGQVCVFGQVGEQRKLAYLIEYKAPHKLHTQHLERGLRPMDIVDELVNKPTEPTTGPARFQHYSELIATAAVTQTYSYMIEAGLEYGYLTNGDSFVFLRIDWDNPAVLYYHLAQPSREVEANGDPEVNGAVSQVLVFTALALFSTQKSNDVRVAAAHACQTYKMDYDSLLHRVATLEEEVQDANETNRPATTRLSVPSDPDWTPKSVKRTEKGATSGPASGTVSGSRSDNHTTPASTQPSMADTHGKACRKAYCTAQCLLSLVNGGALDRKCPNVSLHGGKAGGKGKGKGKVQKHPVSFAQWTTLLRAELAQSLDKSVLVLGKEGACGALFQVSLLQFGYTFVAKGGTGRSIPKLQNEHGIYERLGPLQGRNIPMCLGLIDLRELSQVYYYDFDVRIVYFLLLSFGGPRCVALSTAVLGRMRSRIKSVVDEMHRLGVVHGDIDLLNVLRGPNDQPVLIDFHKGRLMPVEATATQDTKKRKRRNGEDEDQDILARLAANHAVATPADLDAETRVMLYRDRVYAQSIFG